MNGELSRRQAPSVTFLVCILLAAQTLGTMATAMLPAVAPKVAETYGVHSSLIGYQISLLAAAMLVSLMFGGNLSRLVQKHVRDENEDTSCSRFVQMPTQRLIR